MKVQNSRCQAENDGGVAKKGTQLRVTGGARRIMLNLQLAGVADSLKSCVLKSVVHHFHGFNPQEIVVLMHINSPVALINMNFRCRLELWNKTWFILSHSSNKMFTLLAVAGQRRQWKT